MSPSTRQNWAEQFTALARDYWTDERVAELTAGSAV
jgi:hypothetical protein